MGRTLCIPCHLSLTIVFACVHPQATWVATREREDSKRLLQSSMASAGGTKIQTLIHTCSPHSSFHAQRQFFPSLLGVGDMTYKTHTTDCSPSQCVLFARHFQPQFKAQPGTRNSQPAGTALPVKQKWSWDQNSLPQLNTWGWPCTEGFLLLPEGSLHHPYVPYCNWAMTYLPEAEQATAFYSKVSSSAEFTILFISSSSLLQIPKSNIEWKDQKTCRSYKKLSATCIAPLKFSDTCMENTLHNHYNKIFSLLLQHPKPPGRENKGEFFKRQGELREKSVGEVNMS